MIQGYLIAGLAGILLAVGSSVFVGYKAYKMGGEANELEHQKADALAREISDKAIAVAAAEIGKIEIRHQTIRQEVQREVIEKPVFRDCRNTADSFRLLNDALTNRDTESADRIVLPSPDAPSG